MYIFKSSNKYEIVLFDVLQENKWQEKSDVRCLLVESYDISQDDCNVMQFSIEKENTVMTVSLKLMERCRNDW